MAEVSKSEATLRFLGDDLDPDEITLRLGIKPMHGARKGEPMTTPGGKKITARTGIWCLSAPTSEPGDIDLQVLFLLEGATSDLATWREFAARYNGEFFVGLFLEGGNEGIGIRPETLSAIGSRGLQLDLDIYRLGDDEEEAD
jgi:hypothetical protein